MTKNAPDNTGRNDTVVPQGLHVVAKPIGPACNLDCEYCFYLEKQALFAAGGQYRMPYPTGASCSRFRSCCPNRFYSHAGAKRQCEALTFCEYGGFREYRREG
jgi:sulfatase maturation enzyme AslB (radical SAM superfamily)